METKVFQPLLFVDMFCQILRETLHKSICEQN